MRVCFVSRRFFPTVSGMSVYAVNLLRELVALGHDVTMLAQFRGDPLGTRVYGGGPPPEVAGVRVIGLESLGEQDGGDFERDIDAIVRTIEAEHARAPFDLLHAQYGYPPGLAVLEASRRTGVPNVVSIQGGDGHWVGTCCETHATAMRAVLGHAGALLIGSASFAAEVSERHGVPAERFTIVPGAVDLGRFAPRDSDAVGEIADGRPRLLYHGRVDARKGVLDLLDAAVLLRGRRPFSLTVSGIGPDSDRAAVRVRELGLEGEVALTGYADYARTPEVYREGDVFVSPTYAEGFSNTILEAMASGLPIVSTRVVGVVDCLRDEDNALLVEPADPPALAAALDRLLDDDALRRDLAARALNEVRERYGWPAAARAIERVYTAVRDTAPDRGWKAPVGVAPCRFRATPHLL